MSDNVYKTIEVTGSSESVRNLEWLEVGDIRGHIEGGSVRHFQVTVKLGFRLE